MYFSKCSKHYFEKKWECAFFIPALLRVIHNLWTPTCKYNSILHDIWINKRRTEIQFCWNVTGLFNPYRPRFSGCKLSSPIPAGGGSIITIWGQLRRMCKRCDWDTVQLVKLLNQSMSICTLLINWCTLYQVPMVSAAHVLQNTSADRCVRSGVDLWCDLPVFHIRFLPLRHLTCTSSTKILSQDRFTMHLHTNAGPEPKGKSWVAKDIAGPWRCAA